MARLVIVTSECEAGDCDRGNDDMVIVRMVTRPEDPAPWGGRPWGSNVFPNTYLSIRPSLA